MFDRAERTQIRAALRLWLQISRNSKQHPSEVPACKAEFLADGEDPMVDARIEALIITLSGKLELTTLTTIAKEYGVSTARLKKELGRRRIFPLPESKIYFRNDVVHAMRLIEERDSRGRFH